IASGVLTVSDVDSAQTFNAVLTPTAGTNGYGSYTLASNGSWTYTLDNSNAFVQALNVGQTLSDTFTAVTADGTTQLVTITINGRNDAANISGDISGSVIEAGGVSNAITGTPTATGTLVSTDVDNAATFQAVTTATAG